VVGARFSYFPFFLNIRDFIASNNKVNSHKKNKIFYEVWANCGCTATRNYHLNVPLCKAGRR
jgi:hypothetical protein